MFIDDLASAPNPQFARPSRVDLNGSWRFAFDDEDVGVRNRWFDDLDRLTQRITVPFPPESRLSGIHDTSYHSVLWYGREFDDSRADDSARLLVKFGAVDYEADVWVDGSHVGRHRGGHTPFHFDVTDALDTQRVSHTVVLRAQDDPHDVEQPRGKQDWQERPHVIWYHRTSGVWQSVWLETVPSVHIETVRWRFDDERTLLDFEVELNRRPDEGSTVMIDVLHDDRLVTSIRSSATARTVIGQAGIPATPGQADARGYLWSPAIPTLLGIRATLDSPGHGDDIVHSYAGLRTVRTRGRRLLINGQSTFLRLVLQQGYWPESQIAAPSPEALKSEAEVILALGFNGARIHQKVEDPRFLYWADRLGLLIWGETANAFTYSERAIERHASEWREAVLRDRNHPSIIAWVPFNESWGVSQLGASAAQRHAVTAAYHRTHQLDGTRPVVGNDGWENTAGDFLTIHDYSWDPAVLDGRYSDESALERTLGSYFPGARPIEVGNFQNAGKPVLVTEFGGVSYAPDDDSQWFGYGKVSTQDEYVAQYRALTNALHGSTLLAGFCYTQLADTEQETNGLLSDNREPKAPLDVLARITRGEDR